MSSKEFKWKQLSGHPGYIQSTLVQLYYTGCPGTPPLYPSSWFFHTCTSCSPWSQTQSHWWRYPPTSLNRQRGGGKPSRTPDPWAGCLPVSRWLLERTCWSQQEQTPKEEVLKPEGRAGSTAPLWPRQSCRRPEMLEYGQVCDQTAPMSGRSFVVKNEHHPPIPSEALQQLKHKKIIVCNPPTLLK